MANRNKGETMYPVINDVRTLQVSCQEEISPDHRNPPGQSEPTNEVKTISSTQATYQDPTSPKYTQVIPQRPEDLLDDIPLDVVRQNVRSSAQYRKSYAFKIWRDRGSFPYRLAEQPVGIAKDAVQRKKSKKCLNALRTQRDREKEEAWKAFKSCRTTSNELKYQRTSKFPRSRVEYHENNQLNTIFSDCKDNDPKSNHAKHQNSIPDYFKNKKESVQKYQPLVSSTKSIPTSVIYVHTGTAKACLLPKQITQAKQGAGITDKGVDNGFESKTQAEIKMKTNRPSEGNIGSERSDTHTSSVGTIVQYNIHDDDQEQLNANAVIGRQQVSIERMAESNALERRISPACVQTNQQEDRCDKLNNSGSLSSAKNPLNGVIDIELSSTEHNGSEQSPSPNSPDEACSNCEIDNSNLAMSIKNSLSKKYIKENVKPISVSKVPTQARKRTRNDPTRSKEGEQQSTRIKQKKTTMFTSLDESVATNLADGIHNVNSEYFPIEALAKKAVKESSKGVTDDIKSKLSPSSIEHKLDEIERAR